MSQLFSGKDTFWKFGRRHKNKKRLRYESQPFDAERANVYKPV